MRVLVVDDEDDALMLLTLGLERLGFVARGVTTVDGALAALGEGSVDAVVTDWHLPEGTAEPVVLGAGARRVVLLTGDERVLTRPWPSQVSALRKPSSLGKIARALRAD